MEQKETASLAPHAFVTVMNYLVGANKAQCKLRITIDQGRNLQSDVGGNQVGGGWEHIFIYISMHVYPYICMYIVYNM